MEILSTIGSAIGNTIGKGIATVGIILGGWFGFHQPEVVQPIVQQTVQPQIVGADTMSYVGGSVYYIAGSGISSSATSIPLTSLTIKQNGYPLQDSDFADTFYLTIEPGDNTKQEFASCTTVGTNTGGAVTLSGCTRGLSPIAPYTASTTLRFTHAGSSKVIFSNSPAFYNQFTAKGNDETITGIYTFSASPIVPTPTTDTQASNKSYVDGVAIAGGADASDSIKGISKLSVAPASSTNPIAVGDNDTRVPPIDTSTMTAGQVAALVGTSGTGASSTNKFVDNNDTSGTGTINRGGSSFLAFGDGSDGAYIATTSISLTRDMFYTDLTINNAVTISTNGYKVFVSGTLTQVGTGMFITNGDAGTLPVRLATSTGALGATAANPPLAGSAGVASSSVASITNPTASSVAGGAGGAAAAGAGGSAGGSSVAGTVVSSKKQLNYNTVLFDSFLSLVSGTVKHVDYHAGNGSGGGGGACNSTQSDCAGGNGGASGANGGIIIVFANAIVTESNPLASSTGTDGANGTAGTAGTNNYGGGGGGGGSGGNGGLVVFVYKTLTGSLSATLTGGAAGTGGAGGAGSSGAGTAGSNGSAGLSGLLVTVEI